MMICKRQHKGALVRSQDQHVVSMQFENTSLQRPSTIVTLTDSEPSTPDTATGVHPNAWLAAGANPVSIL